MEPYSLPVIHPEHLPPSLPASITRLPGRYNFKPHIGLLPDGDLVMFVAHTHSEEVFTSQNVELPARSLASHVVLYRSADGGKTWGRGRHVPELVGGHEPSVSVVDGILLVKTMVHGDGWYPDPYARRDHSYAVIARSEDGGETFETALIDRAFTGAAADEVIETTRTIHRLPDGRLLLGVGIGARQKAAYSDDMGRTWRLEEARFAGASYEGVRRSFFCEGVLFATTDNRLRLLARVDFAYARFAAPLPHDTAYTGGTGSDNFDGLVLFDSVDEGRTWTPRRAVGFPTLMYPSVVDLGGRLLLTYTVREIPPPASGAVHPHVGIQAVVAAPNADGDLDFDFGRDLIVLDDSTPAAMRNAGGFGNTLRLTDGTLVTPFSYPLIDPDILELAERKEYLKEEVYDYWASLQSTYPQRYKDIVRDDPDLTELHLRRSFSALFLYAQAANKGGIATAVLRWSLPSTH